MRGGGEGIAIVECHRSQCQAAGEGCCWHVGVGRPPHVDQNPNCRGSGEMRAAIAEWHGEGGGVVDGCRGQAWRQGPAANGAGEHLCIPLVLPFIVLVLVAAR